MAYMMMLVLENADQMYDVWEAWESLHVDEVTFVESTCARAQPARRHHIPMRFMFENLSGGPEVCSLTLFGIVPDEAGVQACITAAESVLGDLNASRVAMLAAWPLAVVKGYPKREATEEG